MLKRVGKINIGIFGEFTSLGAHIILDYLFEDSNIDGFIYKRKPVLKDFQIFSKIFVATKIFKKFEKELTKLAEKRRVNIVHEDQETLTTDNDNSGILHLYVCHSQRAIIDAEHRHTLSGIYIKK